MPASTEFRELIIFREADARVYAENNRRKNLNRFKAILKRSTQPPLTLVFHYLVKDSGIDHVRAAWALRGIYDTLEQQGT